MVDNNGSTLCVSLLVKKRGILGETEFMSWHREDNKPTPTNQSYSIHCMGDQVAFQRSRALRLVLCYIPESYSRLNNQSTQRNPSIAGTPLLRRPGYNTMQRRPVMLLSAEVQVGRLGMETQIYIESA